MDKEYLYLRVRTDSSVQQTPNPKEKYVLIYPVVQEDEDNNINMSIHLKDHLGNTHKVSGSTQKINLLQNQLDTLQGDLISILQEILGYTDTSESSSSMSSDILQPIGFVLTGCDIHAINGQYYYTVSDNGTVVSYDKRIEESEMYVKIYYDEYFNNGCWVIYNENDGGVECYNSSLNSDATIQQVAQCEWQSYDIAVETPPSFDRFIYDSIGGGESSESSQSSSSDSINYLVLAAIENPSDYSIIVNGVRCDNFEEYLSQWIGAEYAVSYFRSTSQWQIDDTIMGTFMWRCDQVDCTKPDVWQRSEDAGETFQLDSTMSVQIVRKGQ